MAQRLFGRSLSPADTALTVRVRDGQIVLDERPIPGAAAFLSGLDVIECADLDTSLPDLDTPLPDLDTPRATLDVPLDTPHGRSVPYLLLGWLGDDPRATAGPGRELIEALHRWRRELDLSGHYIMGSSFGGVEAATTMRLFDRGALVADSPFIRVHEQMATVDVIAVAGRPAAIALAAGRPAAIALAATHPLAAGHAVEVRAFAA